MKNIALADEEIIVVIKAMEICLKKCQSGGAEKGCDDCTTLAKVLDKIKEI